MFSRRFGAAALCAAIAVGVAACGGSDNNSGSSTGSSSAASSTPAAASTTSSGTSGIPQASIDRMAEYTGGKAGPADSSLAPVKVGYTDQQGGTPSFDEMEAGPTAATKFINEHLGGINGHPLELDKCFIQVEEDGQKCGAQFLSDKVPLVIEGLAVVGNASLYKTVAGKIPVNVSNAATGPDVTTKGVYLYNGGSMGVVFGWAKDLEALKPKFVAMVSVGKSGSCVQLLAPLTPESTIARFLDRSGPGVQQVAYRVTDLDEASASARAQGMRLLYESPRRGTAASRVNFIHPKDAGGVLVELVEPAEPAEPAE